MFFISWIVVILHFKQSCCSILFFLSLKYPLSLGQFPLLQCAEFGHLDPEPFPWNWYSSMRISFWNLDFCCAGLLSKLSCYDWNDHSTSPKNNTQSHVIHIAVTHALLGVNLFILHHLQWISLQRSTINIFAWPLTSIASSRRNVWHLLQESSLDPPSRGESSLSNPRWEETFVAVAFLKKGGGSVPRDNGECLLMRLKRRGDLFSIIRALSCCVT